MANPSKVLGYVLGGVLFSGLAWAAAPLPSAGEQTSLDAMLIDDAIKALSGQKQECEDLKKDIKSELEKYRTESAEIQRAQITLQKKVLEELRDEYFKEKPVTLANPRIEYFLKAWDMPQSPEAKNDYPAVKDGIFQFLTDRLSPKSFFKLSEWKPDGRKRLNSVYSKFSQVSQSSISSESSNIVPHKNLSWDSATASSFVSSRNDWAMDIRLSERAPGKPILLSICSADKKGKNSVCSVMDIQDGRKIKQAAAAFDPPVPFDEYLMAHSDYRARCGNSAKESVGQSAGNGASASVHDQSKNRPDPRVGGSGDDAPVVGGSADR